MRVDGTSGRGCVRPMGGGGGGIPPCDRVPSIAARWSDVERAELRVERAVIDDVVPVRAAGPGLQVRRCVDVRDPQLREVRHDPGRVLKREARVELQSVRGLGRRALAPLRPPDRDAGRLCAPRGMPRQRAFHPRMSSAQTRSKVSPSISRQGRPGHQSAG